MTQLDLFGQPLDKIKRADFFVRTHDWHKKMYKSCATNTCKNTVLNKPWNHYCWECLIDFYTNNAILAPVGKPIPLVVCVTLTNGAKQ